MNSQTVVKNANREDKAIMEHLVRSANFRSTAQWLQAVADGTIPSNTTPVQYHVSRSPAGYYVAQSDKDESYYRAFYRESGHIYLEVTH